MPQRLVGRCRTVATGACSGFLRPGSRPWAPGPAVGAALLLALAAGGAVPAAAQTGAPCADINNTTDYSWPIRMQIGDGPPQQFRIEKRTFGRMCMRNIPSTDKLTVSVRSTWMPVGECTFPPGGLVTIESRKNSDGEDRTHVGCALPRN